MASTDGNMKVPSHAHEILAQTTAILLLIMCDYGYGKHEKSISAPNLFKTLELFWYAQMFYKVNINVTKASILLLYLRIFTLKPYRIASYVLLALVTAFGTALAFSSIFQCIPVPRAYNKKIAGHCIDLTKAWYANAAFSIVTDFLILILPMPVIWQLKMPTRQKIGLMGLFALGTFVLITSILRATTLDNSKDPDTTWEVTISIWTVIETNVGIICACLPVLAKPLSKLFPSVLGKNSSAPESYLTGTQRSKAAVNAESKNNHPWYPLQMRSDNNGVDENGMSPPRTSVQARRRSDEETLCDGNPMALGIQKKTEFMVRYDDNSEFSKDVAESASHGSHEEV
ncbi:MAG: hypothetical protein M1827_003635 [Pycnora praestabilis]|nr:MAG: hypothetical protein M1827_003635 [Pycnora praestabilis]